MQQPAFIHTSPTTSIDTLTTAIHGTTDNVNDGVAADTSIRSDNLERLALNPTEYRFLRKSSSAMVVEAAMELKQEYTQSVEPAVSTGSLKPRTEFWAPQEVRQPLLLLILSKPLLS